MPPRRRELCRKNTRAGGESLCSHLFAEDQSGNEERKREDGRAVKNTGERLSKFGIGDRSGRGEVHSSADALIIEREEDRRDRIVNGYPAEELLPAAEAPAHPEAKGRQHLRERASAFAQDHPEAKI